MKKPEQWLKERCVPEGPLWDKQPSWKEWIEEIQTESFQEGWEKGMRDAMDMSSKGLRMDIVSDSINKKGLWEKPLAKSQEGVR